MGNATRQGKDRDRTVIEVDGRDVAMAVRRSGRARRVSLKVDVRIGGVELVLPKRASMKSGMAFVREQREWIAARLSEMPPVIQLADGAVLPLRGVTHRVRHRPDRRGTVWIEGGEIHVAGAPEHLPRRLTDWLKAEARHDLRARANDYAAQLDVRVGGVTIRDTRSRWGSCSSSGRLSFSWRLVMAPNWILDYVAAHEVSHLKEMSHNTRFWRMVDQLYPNRHRAEAWLREHGNRLQSIA